MKNTIYLSKRFFSSVFFPEKDKIFLDTLLQILGQLSYISGDWISPKLLYAVLQIFDKVKIEFKKVFFSKESKFGILFLPYDCLP